ncbi:hypothetical protein AMELA_G00030270, partial [Ameiurus melas]
LRLVRDHVTVSDSHNSIFSDVIVSYICWLSVPCGVYCVVLVACGVYCVVLVPCGVSNLKTTDLNRTSGGYSDVYTVIGTVLYIKGSHFGGPEETQHSTSSPPSPSALFGNKLKTWIIQ